MVRPQKNRRVNFNIPVSYYKPRGIPLSELQEIEITLDELEAIRLADHEGMYHEEASEKMNVSRATFGRILTEARKKIATGITQGMALKIEGGNVEKVNENFGRGRRYRGRGRRD